jgi:hypothetical protein
VPEEANMAKKRRVPDAQRQAELAEQRQARDASALRDVFNKLKQRLEYNLCKYTPTGDDLLELTVRPEDRIVVKRALEIGDIKSYFFDNPASFTKYPLPEEALPYTEGVFVPRIWFNIMDSEYPFLPVNYKWLNPDRSLPARVKLDEWVTNKIMVEHKFQTLIWLNNQFGKMGMNYAQASFYFSSMRYLCEQAKIYAGKGVPEDIPNITPKMRHICVIANQIVAQALLLPAVPENAKPSGVLALGSFEALSYKVV